MTRIAYVIVPLLMIAFAISNAQVALEQKMPTRLIDSLDNAVGREVIVEGLAWGYMNKGLSNWVMTGQGQRLYISGIDFEQLNGRLVRLTGTLRKKRMEAAPPGAQGYGRAFEYFTIEVTSAEVIDQVSVGHLQVKELAAKSSQP